MMMKSDEKKYRQLYLKEFAKSFEFLTAALGFEQKEINNEQAFFTCDQLGNYFLLLICPDANSHGPLLIYTNDCLRNYFELKRLGIVFINEPKYTTRGLMVEFTDNQGKYYRLLEERLYED